jgi:hypothetical protein
MCSEEIVRSTTYQALLKEALFTKEMLGTGATQIRRANYTTRGVYFQAFTSLSTGLERIGKLSLMLDYRLDHGTFPDLKHEIGHDIVRVYDKSTQVIARRAISMEFLSNLNDPIHYAILTILSEFAKGDRYSNIDLLVGAKRQSDPIAAWYNQVDQPLFQRGVPESKKAMIRQRSGTAAEVLGPYSTVLHTSESGDTINNVEDISFRTGMYEAVAPLRQLYVLQVIRYFSELLLSLHDLMLSDQDIPYFREVFALFCSSDRYMRTRKTWEKV